MPKNENANLGGMHFMEKPHFCMPFTKISLIKHITERGQPGFIAV